MVAICFQIDETAESVTIAAQIKELAEKLNIPTLDMSDWVIGDPGYLETDELINESIQEIQFRPRP